jgi:hypothetical protein
MKINNSQAAFLYLLLFNIGEAGNEDLDPLEEQANTILEENNYPARDNYIPDEDGWPATLEWSDGFSPDTWFEDHINKDFDNWPETSIIGIKMGEIMDCYTDHAKAPIIHLENILQWVAI